MKRVAMLLLGLSLVLYSSAAMAKKVVIEDGKKVKIDYTLTVDEKMVDTSEGKTPLEYVQGNKMIIPGLEKQLAGLKVGDEKKVTVTPEEGYGQIDPTAVVDVAKKNFGETFDPKVGMLVQMKSQDGKQYAGVIKEIKDETVTVDFNHPLAGKELNFAIKIVSIE